MDEETLLKLSPKKTKGDTKWRKHGIFGLSLGEKNYNRLDAYCRQHNLYKATVVRALVVEYLDKNEINSKVNLDIAKALKPNNRI